MNREKLNRVGIFLTVFILLFIFSFGLQKGLEKSGGLNLYTHQAEAFLNGRLHVDAKDDMIDLAFFEGREYVAFPPFPALVLLPAVALFGVSGTHAVYIAILLTGLIIYVLNDISRRIGVENNWNRLWIIAAFTMGTGYWFCVRMSYEVYFLAHVVALVCIFFCIREALGRGRGVVCGLLLAAALLSRQMSLYIYFFIAALLWERKRDRDIKADLLNIFYFSVVFFVAGVCVYLAYNWARFGDPLDTGYAYMPLRGFLKTRVDLYGQFNLKYVPFNLQKMFFQGFNVFYTGADRLTPNIDTFGTSLTYASPFIFFAFRAKTSRIVYWAGLLSVLLCIAHQSLYYNNGYLQVNCNRFALDYLPVLIVMVAMALKQKECSKIFAGLAIYAVLINAVALILLPLLLN